MEFWKVLIILIEIKKRRQIFARLGENPIKIWNFWEKFLNLDTKISMENWFFTNFLTHLQGLLSFYTPLEHTKIFGVGLGR